METSEQSTIKTQWVWQLSSYFQYKWFEDAEHQANKANSETTKRIWEYVGVWQPCSTRISCICLSPPFLSACVYNYKTSEDTHKNGQIWSCSCTINVGIFSLHRDQSIRKQIQDMYTGQDSWHVHLRFNFLSDGDKALVVLCFVNSTI